MKTFFVRRWIPWLALGVLVFWCGRSAAQDSQAVLVLGPESPLRSGFVSALQIEAGEQYQVRAASQPVPETLPERIALGSTLVESEHAFAIVWIEQASGASAERTALLYVVGRRAGRALLEVVQAPDARGLDLERMLAIKLAELLAQLRDDVVHPLNPAQDEPPPTAAAASQPESAAGFWGAISLGPRFDAGLGTGWSRFGLGAALAPELSLGDLRVALGLGLDVYPSLEVRANGSEVSLSEVTPRVFAGLSWFTEAVSFSLQSGPSWSVLSVHGRTALGYENGDTVSGFGWFVALCAERAFTASLALGARLELHAAERRLSFDVNDMTVLDRGRLHLTLGIDLTFRTSITATSP